MILQRDIMDVFFDVFRLPVPVWTDRYEQALASVGQYSCSFVK